MAGTVGEQAEHDQTQFAVADETAEREAARRLILPDRLDQNACPSRENRRARDRPNRASPSGQQE